MIRRSILLIACVFASTTTAIAQSTAPSGLDSLSDERLMTDLANRGQNNLLDRAFDLNKVPPVQRDAIRAISALRQLNDPAAHLSASQRQSMARQIAAGIEAALPILND